MQSVRRGGKVDRGTDRRDRAKLVRTCASPFARKFQHQIAAHGISRQSETGDVVLLDQILGHGSDVLGSSGMVKRGSQRLGAAAVALIHPDHVHAAGKTFGGNPQHVGGIARAFKAMDDDDRQRASADRFASDSGREPGPPVRLRSIAPRPAAETMRRERKKLARVCRCPPLNPRRGTNPAFSFAQSPLLDFKW